MIIAQYLISFSRNQDRSFVDQLVLDGARTTRKPVHTIIFAIISIASIVGIFLFINKLKFVTKEDKGATKAGFQYITFFLIGMCLKAAYEGVVLCMNSVVLGLFYILGLALFVFLSAFMLNKASNMEITGCGSDEYCREQKKDTEGEFSTFKIRLFIFSFFVASLSTPLWFAFYNVMNGWLVLLLSMLVISAIAGVCAMVFTTEAKMTSGDDSFVGKIKEYVNQKNEFDYDEKEAKKAKANS